MTLFDSLPTTEPFLVYPDSLSEPEYDARIESDDFFSTLLDIINPLQHIPLISNLYRELTGDEIEPAARLVGGAVFGGPIGFASASANVLLEQTSGDDMVGHALAMLSNDPIGPAPRGAPTVLPQEAGEPDTLELAQTRVDVVAEDIVWGAPGVLPSLAGRNAAQPPVELAATRAVPVTPAPATVIPVQPQAAGAKPHTDTQAQAPTGEQTTSGWLADAMKDAASADDAQQKGAAPVINEARPWVANAILDGLDKYEALARARAENEPTTK